MGVDNNGILFLGLEISEVNLEMLPNFSCDEPEELEDRVWVWGRENDIPLLVQWDNGFNYEHRLIGFTLADSGSYGTRIVKDLPGDMKKRTKEFTKLFNEKPRIYIMNYQS